MRASLVDPVERDHRQSDRGFWWRRGVAAVTIVVGAVLLSLSLDREPGDPSFYTYTLLLAATWTVGAFASGPLHAGWAHTSAGDRHTRPLLQPFLVAVLAVMVFTVGAVVVARIPFMRDSINSVLDHARYAPLPIVGLITLLNGVAEELFFRGALFAAIGVRYPVPISAALYTLATVATGNVMLVFAAAVLGLLVGLQRRVTGGVLAPIVTHVTWSLSMLFILPPLLTAVA